MILFARAELLGLLAATWVCGFGVGAMLLCYLLGREDEAIKRRNEFRVIEGGRPDDVA